jgi:hypothetical protein
MLLGLIAINVHDKNSLMAGNVDVDKIANDDKSGEMNIISPATCFNLQFPLSLTSLWSSFFFQQRMKSVCWLHHGRSAPHLSLAADENVSGWRRFG